MPRYSLPLLAVVLSFIISGCAKQQAGLEHDYVKDNEYTLLAYDSLYQNRYDEAYFYFNKLYKKSLNGEYFIESAKVLIQQKKYDMAIKECEEYLKTKEDSLVRKLLIQSYKSKKEYKKAIVALEKLLDYEKDKLSYLLAAEIYLLDKDYEKSIEYYKKSYDLEPTDYTVDKIAEILYLSLDKIDEAIKYYETHIMFHGCGDFLCQRVAALYAKKNDINGVISSYKRMYDQESNPVIGRKIIDLYLLKNDYKGIQEFLEASRLDDLMLLKVLKYNHEYKKAAETALKLYKVLGEIDYFAQYVMYSFESGNQKDKKLIKRTIKDLKSILKENNSHVYLNYLGYLLIDNDIDVKDGIKYIKEALKQDENNFSYLDSLAWGYYKQKEYKKAYDVIIKVKESLGQDPIVKEHYDIIKKKYEAVKKKKRK